MGENFDESVGAICTSKELARAVGECILGGALKSFVKKKTLKMKIFYFKNWESFKA